MPDLLVAGSDTGARLGGRAGNSGRLAAGCRCAAGRRSRSCQPRPGLAGHDGADRARRDAEPGGDLPLGIAVRVPLPDQPDLGVGELGSAAPAAWARQVLVAVADRALDQLVDQRGLPRPGSPLGQGVAGAQPARDVGEHGGKPSGEVVLGARGIGDGDGGLAGVARGGHRSASCRAFTAATAAPAGASALLIASNSVMSWPCRASSPVSSSASQGYAACKCSRVMSWPVAGCEIVSRMLGLPAGWFGPLQGARMWRPVLVAGGGPAVAPSALSLAGARPGRMSRQSLRQGVRVRSTRYGSGRLMPPPTARRGPALPRAAARVPRRGRRRMCRARTPSTSTGPGRHRGAPGSAGTWRAVLRSLAGVARLWS